MIDCDKNSKILVAFLVFVAIPLWSGCGGVYDSTVSGVVSLDDSALPRGTVSYNPAQPGPASYGLIESDGTYFIRTGREEGLPPGEYTVTVVAKEEAVLEDPNSSLPPTPGKTITPPWYLSKKTSPLKMTVEPGSNEINLELTSDPPADWELEPKKRRKRRR